MRLFALLLSWGKVKSHLFELNYDVSNPNSSMLKLLMKNLSGTNLSNIQPKLTLVRHFDLAKEVIFNSGPSNAM